MDLTDKQRKYLRTLAHPRKPIVTLGNAGLTDAVIAELDLALDAHELVKVRVRAADREERDALIDTILVRTGAAQVQRVGHVLTLYRRNRDNSKVTLP
ncbi:MAG: ribosome assembly RNA-binding protein YhbY [Gammaproteobacteria bacterium]